MALLIKRGESQGVWLRSATGTAHLTVERIDSEGVHLLVETSRAQHLTLHAEQDIALDIGEPAQVRVIFIAHSLVQLAIDAPQSIAILRDELLGDQSLEASG